MGASKDQSYGYVEHYLDVDGIRVGIILTGGNVDKDNSYAFSIDVDYSFGNRGVRNRGGWLNDDLHCLPNRAHRQNDRFLAHDDNVIHVTLDDLKIRLADICSQSIGDRKFLFGHEPSPGAKG